MNVQTYKSYKPNRKSVKKLIVSQATFESMLLGIIQSGVTFEAHEIPGGQIEVIFSGGF